MGIFKTKKQKEEAKVKIKARIAEKIKIRAAAKAAKDKKKAAMKATTKVKAKAKVKAAPIAAPKLPVRSKLNVFIKPVSQVVAHRSKEGKIIDALRVKLTSKKPIEEKGPINRAIDEFITEKKIT